jgi:hypothetical protein
MADPQLVLFVCPHGAGKSRMAAAYFNTVAGPRWMATSAGITPQATVSAHAARLLDGTPAAPALDTALPRPIHAVADPNVVVAIDCPTPPTPGAVPWRLRHQDFDASMRDEIRELVEGLAADLGALPKPEVS